MQDWYTRQVCLTAFSSLRFRISSLLQRLFQSETPCRLYGSFLLVLPRVFRLSVKSAHDDSTFFAFCCFLTDFVSYQQLHIISVIFYHFSSPLSWFSVRNSSTICLLLLSSTFFCYDLGRCCYFRSAICDWTLYRPFAFPSIDFCVDWYNWGFPFRLAIISAGSDSACQQPPPLFVLPYRTLLREFGYDLSHHPRLPLFWLLCVIKVILYFSLPVRPLSCLLFEQKHSQQQIENHLYL